MLSPKKKKKLIMEWLQDSPLIIFILYYYLSHRTESKKLVEVQKRKKNLAQAVLITAFLAN